MCTRAPPLTTSSSARPCRINSTPGRDETLSFPAASRAMSQNPDPDSNDARVSSPQAVVLIVKMPQAVHGIWPILLLWTPHGSRMLQVD